MPYDEVMHKWKEGELHSGSEEGPKVKSQKQAVAIMLSEKRKARTNPEYRPSKERHMPGTLHRRSAAAPGFGKGPVA